MSIIETLFEVEKNLRTNLLLPALADKVLSAIEVIKKQQNHSEQDLNMVQEPVAWMFCLDGCNQVVLDEDSDSVIRHNGTPLVPAPVQPVKQEEAKLPVEPVAWALSHSQGIIFSSKYPMRESKEIVEQMAREHMGAVVVTPLYAAPVRTKDLTDDEAQKLWNDTSSIVPMWAHHLHFARAVIAAYKEKNK
jgi:hypothetical protein